MPMFPIESFTVTRQLERRSGVTKPGHVLELTGPADAAGHRDRAVFAFAGSFDDGAGPPPIVGYLTHGPAGRSIVGWFPLAQFDLYCETLRRATAPNVLFEFRDPHAASGYLRRLGLGCAAQTLVALARPSGCAHAEAAPRPDPSFRAAGGAPAAVSRG